ncbi:MAG: MgtC/SapB family protein, partial [Halobacteriaceae archaeon]
MAGIVETVATVPTDSNVVRIALAVALGLFLGLEREWSQKAAGIRTFALISTLGTIFTIFDTPTSPPPEGYTALYFPLLSAVGALFITLLAGMLMFSGYADEDEGLHLTTAVSMLVAYGVGILVGVGHLLPATVVTVASSLLLVFKRELHGIAWGLSREELRSASEFAIIAFVVYPLLPAGGVTLGPGQFAITIEPRIIWLMVVF